MHDDAYLELCAAHALGCLDPMDAVRLREHLAAGCTECHEELTQHRDTVEQVGRAFPAITPPAGAEARLMSRIKEEAMTVTQRRRSPVMRWALPLAAAVAMVLLARVAVQRGEDIESLGREMEDLRGAFERVVAEYELDGTELAPRAHAVAYVDRHDGDDPSDDELMLHVTDLDPPPEDMVYQMWMPSDGSFRPLGVVRIDENGEALTSLKGYPASHGQIRITLESRTGVDQPTGPDILKRKAVLPQR
jgi:hypothetical protein